LLEDRRLEREPEGGDQLAQLAGLRRRQLARAHRGRDGGQRRCRIRRGDEQGELERDGAVLAGLRHPVEAQAQRRHVAGQSPLDHNAR
jgi:hypothetical protein